MTLILVESVATFALVFTALAAGLAGLRLLRGPSLADRAIAADLLTLIGVAGSAVLAARTAEIAFLDVALGLSLFGFVGTVALAYVLQSRQGGR
jgi:multicomponent Na+:H+ antiporter subunit F